MCLIVDANVACVFLAGDNPVIEWLLRGNGKGRLVASGLLKRELSKIDAVRRLLVQLERAGRLRSVNEAQLEAEQERLRLSGCCRSDDPHVLALAILSGARTLATFDRALTDDFHNARIISDPRGSVYKDGQLHGHLLRHTPRSCGVRIERRRSRE